MLWIAAIHLRRRIILSDKVRGVLAITGCASLLLGGLMLWQGCKGEAGKVLRDDVFPINVSYNRGLAASEAYKISHYKQSSDGFSYDARRDAIPSQREVYIMVIGEAARAANWQLYGYHRATNLRLSQRDDIVVFRLRKSTII